MADYSALLMLLTGVTLFTGCDGGSNCYEREYFLGSYYYAFYDYCTFGCCGYETSRSCCSSYYYDLYAEYTSVTLSIGVIIGAVVGGVVFLGILISVIICCICKCTNKKRVRGTVVTPSTNDTTGVSVVTTSVTAPSVTRYQQHAWSNYPPQPPSYDRIMAQPPNYPGTPNGSSPAYPPPPTAPPITHPPPPNSQFSVYPPPPLPNAPPSAYPPPPPEPSFQSSQYPPPPPVYSAHPGGS